MRGFIVAAFAVLALGGCASTLEGAYDDHARSECERESRPSERGQCLDQVDRNRSRR